jgi:hypothetical protein
MMKTACLTLASVLTLCLLVDSPAWATDCDRSVELYNQGTEATDATQKERLFKEALAMSATADPR